MANERRTSGDGMQDEMCHACRNVEAEAYSEICRQTSGERSEQCMIS